MVNVKKRIYTIGLIILGSVLLVSGILVWKIMDEQGKKQDKFYSGAKLVNSIEESSAQKTLC